MRDYTLENRVAKLEKEPTKVGRKFINNELVDVYEFEDEISRYIHNIFIELVKKDQLSDEDIEDLRDMKTGNVYINDYNMWIIDYIIKELKSVGYSSDEIKDYGIRTIREVLSDCAL